MAQVYNKIYTPEKWEKVNPENKHIIDDFILEYKARKKSEGTIKQYYNDARIVAIYCLEHLDNKSFLELTRRDFRNFMIHAQDEWHLSAARCNRELSMIHMMLAYCEDDTDEYEDYDRNASEKIKGIPKEEIRDIIFVPDEDIEALYNKLMKEERYKEATLLGILYDSGCRKHEILQVERASITDEGNATNIVRGKRGKKFRVLYFQRTKDAFKKYEETRTDDSPMLFINGIGETATSGNVYDWVKRWVKDLKEVTGNDYDGLTVHRFRHCFVNNLKNGTHYLCTTMGLGALPIEKIQLLCHHGSADMTLSYAEKNDDKEIEDLFGIKLG